MTENKDLKELIRIAEDFYGVSEEDLRNTSKKTQELSKIRSFIMCMMINYKGYSENKACKLMGFASSPVARSINKLTKNPERLSEMLNVFVNK
jgi:hypothetical protein